ncbi:MAG: diguanylate cyclase, partial [Lachnospiraceae bacterium]|nr:diguanylate cyclase [Candidatus Equihabitans merdae]
MTYSFVSLYTFISLILAFIDLWLGHLCQKQGTAAGNHMRNTAVCAAFVALTYLASILTYDKATALLMSGLYFSLVDWTLVCLILTVIEVTRAKPDKISRFFMRFMIGFSIFESVEFLINTCYPFSLDLIPIDALINHFSYDMKPLYTVHLGFTYLMVLTVLGMLIRRSIRVPAEYRIQYTSSIAAILLVVGINAIFLFISGDSVINRIDTSIAGYSLATGICYWGWFIYTKTSMLKSLSLKIIDNIGQGIILFDHEEHLIMNNKSAAVLLGVNGPTTDTPKKELEDYCSINIKESARSSAFTTQCYVERGGITSPIRCDYRCLKNKKDQITGYLYIMTDVSLETDLMTGFQTWKGFMHYLDLNTLPFAMPCSVVVFDINNLAITNNTFGREMGDKMIRNLAGTLREVYPAESFFIRGNNAELFVITPGMDEQVMTLMAEDVISQNDFSMQYATDSIKSADEDLLKALENAGVSLQNKKLMDKNSTHSQALTSLVQALQESDSETEAHVRRTQQLGSELGSRLNLSDKEQSQLSLLCLLHDIGKIGIPLELLNKPGHLSDTEWTVMKTHVDKGYQIAMSSAELKGIADSILHHHEHWDGSGYPDGLSRESIPLLSRIIAIVDTYDAMTNDRIYRKAVSSAEALVEIKKCAGTQFDPRIASEFIQMLQGSGNGNTTATKTISEESIESKQAADHADKTSAPALPSSQLSQNESVSSRTFRVGYARYILDQNNRILEVEGEFEELTGYSENDIRQKAIYQRDLIPEEDQTDYLVQVSNQLSRSDMAFLEHRLKTKQGDIRYVFCCGRQFYDSTAKELRSDIIACDNAKTHFARMMQEIESSRAQKQLHRWEQTYRRDGLTDLLTHNAFHNDIEAALLKEDTEIMLLMMDVDFFKKYNDTHGHLAGDKLLILLAHTLKVTLRENDLASRMGGDEFAAALPVTGEPSKDMLIKRAQQIFDNL